jgi:hypothetical protein
VYEIKPLLWDNPRAKKGPGLLRRTVEAESKALATDETSTQEKE